MPICDILPATALVRVTSALPLAIGSLNTVGKFKGVGLRGCNKVYRSVIHRCVRTGKCSINMRTSLFSKRDLTSIIRRARQRGGQRTGRHQGTIITFRRKRAIRGGPRIIRPPEIPALSRAQRLLRGNVNVERVTRRHNLTRDAVCGRVNGLVFTNRTSIQSCISRRALATIVRLLIRQPSVPGGRLFRRFRRGCSCKVLDLVETCRVAVGGWWLAVGG